MQQPINHHWDASTGCHLFTFRCCCCNDEIEIPVTIDELKNYTAVTYVQDILLNLDAGQIELMISGTCNRCFDNTFKS